MFDFDLRPLVLMIAVVGVVVGALLAAVVAVICWAFGLWWALGAVVVVTVALIAGSAGYIVSRGGG